MPFNRQGAQVKLDSIKNKDLDKIIQEQPYIPGLGVGYTKQQLVLWAKPKIDLLQTLIDAQDGQARLSILTPIYQSMTVQGKSTVKTILEGSPVVIIDISPDDPEYSKFILALLVHFADPDMRVS